MMSQGTPQELEQRRRLAVGRVLGGWKGKDGEDFLGVTEEAVGRQVPAYRVGGDDALKAEPTPGRRRKLTRGQEQSVVSGPARSPKAFVYKTDLWTTRRLAEVVQRRFGVRFNANYLAARLTGRGQSPQKPEPRPQPGGVRLEPRQVRPPGELRAPARASPGPGRHRRAGGAPEATGAAQGALGQAQAPVPRSSFAFLKFYRPYVVAIAISAFAARISA